MPLLWLSLAFLAGVLLGSLVNLPWVAWAALAAICLPLALVERHYAPRVNWLEVNRRRLRVSLSLLVAALLIGAARYQAHQPLHDAASLAYYNEKKVRLIGCIDSPPDLRDRAVLLRVEALELTPEGGSRLPVEGKALVRLPPGGDWRYGDRLYLSGRLSTPPEYEDFSYRDYLAGRGIYSYMAYPYARLEERGTGSPILTAIYSLRSAAYRQLDRIFPQPEAGLLSGILLGIENDIPADLERAFQDTGTTHIIAISGFNIAILSGLFFSLAKRLLPRSLAAPAAVLVIAGYTVLVGAQASVVRAAIMGGMGLFGSLLGRRQAGANSLAFTAGLMCLFNPLLLWDVGFQLSFMATLGLVLYAEPLQALFEGWASRFLNRQLVSRLAGPVGEYFLFTLAAQLTTLPVILYHFERFSFISFLANVLILPAQPLVMILGGVSLLAGLFWLPAGQLCAYLVWPLVAYTNNTVNWLAQVSPGAIMLGDVPLRVVVLFYLLLFGATLGRGVRERLRRVQPAALLLVLALGGMVLWRGVQTEPDGRLHLSVLAVPDGPALLLQAPGGERVLVNGGSSASQLSSELGRRSSLFNRWLDGLVVTARKAAALDGLPLTMERFPAGMVLWNSDAAGKRAGARLLEVLQRQGVAPQWLESGQRLQIGDRVSLHILLHTVSGTALLVEWDDFQLLVPGGIAPDALLRSFSQQAVGVDVILLSADDLKEHPAGEWQAYNALLYLWAGTGDGSIQAENPRWVSLVQHGWVELQSDGRQLWVRAGQ